MKKLTSVIVIMMIASMQIQSVLAVVGADKIRPSIMITSPTPNSVYEGQSVTYKVSYSDNIDNNLRITLNKSNVRTYGFLASVTVSGSGNTRYIKLSNIQGSEGNCKYIALPSGTCVDSSGNNSFGVTQTATFELKKVPPAPKPPVIVKPEPEPVVKPEPKPEPVVKPEPKPEPVVKPEPEEEAKPKDETAPEVSLKLPEVNVVDENGTYTIEVNIKEEDKDITVSKDTKNIVFEGFTANVSVVEQENIRKIVFTEINGDVKADRKIKILSGFVKDSSNNKSKEIEMKINFDIEKDEKVVDNKPADWIPNPNTGKK